MNKHNHRNILAEIFREAGLLSLPKFYRHPKFYLAVLAAVPVIWVLHGWAPVFETRQVFHWAGLLSIIIWQPFIEELLFRGIIQGQLSKAQWAHQSVFNISSANLVTSVLFVAAHMLNSPLAWSLLIIIPSLLFGYFRDTYNSVYPSMVLHCCYNAMVIVVLWMNGMLLIQPLAP